jgi:hypothetical protein
MGGSDVMGHQAGIGTAELYDPQTGTFSETGSMAAGQGQSWDTGFAATLLKDGRVIVVGSFAKPELYDPKSGKFSVIEAGPDGCESCTATLLADGRVLIIGGDVAETYDPTSGTFSPTGNKLAFQGSLFTATLLPDGRVLVAGDQGTSTSTALFDPKTGVFGSTGSMITPRHEHSAILLDNGQVLLSGGRDSNGNDLASAELYDPSTGSFSLTGSMSTARVASTATLLADGRVLFAGGEAGLASAEAYDAKTGTFTMIGSMTTARAGQSATLLTDGRVLIAGGIDGATVLESAELFRP